MRRTVDQQEVGVLDRIDEVGRRRPVAQAVRVGEPPGLGRELDDVLFALGIDHVVAQTTSGDECGIACDVAGALQELAGLETAMRNAPRM